MKKNIAIVCGCVMVLLSWCDFVYAEKLGLAVDEQKVAFDMDAGETQQFVIKVTNVSDNEQKISIQAIDYLLGENNEITLTEEIDEKYGVRSWITTEAQEITLPAHMGKDVSFNVQVPEHATVGSHRGAVLFRALAADTSTAVSVQGQIGVHVLINIKGDTRAFGELRSFNVPFVSLGDVRYVAEFENTGNIHYVPHAAVTVLDLLTKKNVAYDLNAGDRFVFPEKKIVFEMTQRIPSLFGLYQVQAQFTDGEGKEHVLNDYMIGILFPVTCVAIGVIVWGSFVLVGVMKKKAHASGGKK